jgi:hypothetical protein
VWGGLGAQRRNPPIDRNTSGAIHFVHCALRGLLARLLVCEAIDDLLAKYAKTPKGGGHEMNSSSSKLYKVLGTIVSVPLWAIGWFILVVLLASLGYAFFSPWGVEVSKEYKVIGEFLGAFATPLIAAIALNIAVRQHRNDKQRLLFDAYDKRHLVYAKVTQFLKNILTDGHVGFTHFSVLAEAISESHFLFEGDIHSYLDDLWNKAHKQRQLERALTRGKGDLSENQKEQESLWTYFEEQAKIGARRRFKRYLALR